MPEVDIVKEPAKAVKDLEGGIYVRLLASLPTQPSEIIMSDRWSIMNTNIARRRTLAIKKMRRQT